jgi:hypothetical protein
MMIGALCGEVIVGVRILLLAVVGRFPADPYLGETTGEAITGLLIICTGYG